MTSRWAQLLERVPLGRDRPLLAYGCTLLICGIAFVVRLLAAPVLPSGFPFVCFFPAVILSTFLFGPRPGTMAAMLCGLVAWYCFIPPFFALKMSGGIMFALGFYAVVVIIDILLVDWMQRTTRRLAEERGRSERLAERGELLFRELQHRVSNNLQVIGGLLALQMRGVTDQAARLALDDAARRLALIGRIHRQLYSPHGEQLHLAAFLTELGGDLIDASGKTGVDYRVEAPEDIGLAPEAAVPMALIIAEAVTNAIEHGLADRDKGEILIEVWQRKDGSLDIDVSDDGAGLPPGFDLAMTDSLGLRLAQMLARQLRGSFILSGGQRTVARLRLPGVQSSS
ncbi:histidine kinase [Sphingomonas sp. Root710]|uniref:sensor histidine kinase n=1 Tax=Sphingomonas sp. Root710 TaxID=1736594 RepID=UPI0006FAF3F8|nr:histidine kinase dimerization/phosphoacceptor domain -containing protein [Sphingomonas sp. Root710]KRB83111.1 histidine kinase [Sphingomonas sp. Root710]